MEIFGHEVEVTDVEIVERKEHVSQYRLEDGAVIRVATPPTLIRRIEGQWNADGNPVYIVIVGTTTNVISAPDEIKRPKAPG